MNTQTHKTQENKSQSVASQASKKQRTGEPTFQLIDQRAAAVAQRRLQVLANNSPQMKQLRAFQKMTQARQMAPFQADADNQKAPLLPSIITQPKRQTGSGVMQRMLGFEFETGWYVDFQPPGGFDDLGEIPATVPFAKKDKVSHANHDGFRMEADEAEAGRSELEFVVRPPVAENIGGRGRLDTIMGNMSVITNGLLARFGPQPFGLDEVTGHEYDEMTVVTPRDAQMRAGPQATTALKLDRIPQMLNRAPDQAPQNPAFHGLATLIGQYVGRGAENGAPMSYPKMIAEPLLSRTNFVGLFGLIEPARQLHYIAHPDEWVTDVLQAAGLDPAIADRDLLHRGVVSEDDSDEHIDLRLRIDELELNEPDQHVLDAQIQAATLALANYQAPQGIKAKLLAKLTSDPTLEDLAAIQEQLLQSKAVLQDDHDRWVAERDYLLQQKAGLEVHAGFTVRQWLVGMLAGVDRITALPDAESMGEFGARTENAGPGGDEPAGIFEWRGDQTSKIPPAQWGPYALAFMDRILHLQGHEQD